MMLPLERAWMAQDSRMSADIVSYCLFLCMAGRTEIGYRYYVQYSPGGLFRGCVHWNMKLASCPAVCTVTCNHVSCFDASFLTIVFAVANVNSYWKLILVHLQRLSLAGPFNLHSPLVQIINQHLLHGPLVE